MRTVAKLLIVLSTVFSMGILSTPMLAAAIDCTQSNLSAKDAITCGECGANGSSDCTPQPGSLNNTASNIINLLSILVGIAAVIMIIVGGFRYVTSGGNQESTKSARNTILYALIGLVIVAFAQVIVHFVLRTATNASTNNTSSSSSSSSSSSPPHGIQ